MAGPRTCVCTDLKLPGLTAIRGTTSAAFGLVCQGYAHWAILTVVAVPVAVLLATRGSATVLGDLYAFGLLGAFTLTCLSLDIVRWHERHPIADGARGTRLGSSDGRAGSGVGSLTFALGVLTTVLVALAWSTNLFAKPLATAFGGGVTLVGLLIAFATYTLGRRHGRPFIFPLLQRESYPVIFLSRGRRARPPATVLAILPRQTTQIAALVGAASAVAADGPIVFVQRGRSDPPTQAPRLFEIVNPYLNDEGAQAAFAQAERVARRQGLNHRYLYLPSTAGPEAVASFWRTLQPNEAVTTADDADLLSAIPGGEVRHSSADGVPIVHLSGGPLQGAAQAEEASQGSV